MSQAAVGGVVIFLGSAAAAREQASLNAEQVARIGNLTDEGKTVSVLVAGGQVAGLIAMRDEPRADAKAGLAELKWMGIKTVMVTGDNARTASAIAAALGIEPRADLLPEDKLQIVRELQASGEVVAKVGDGINDAPALAAADIGIAMGHGTDVALETADAAILHGRVVDVARMVDLSRGTMGNIKANITIALGLKAVFLVTTIDGDHRALAGDPGRHGHHGVGQGQHFAFAAHSRMIVQYRLPTAVSIRLPGDVFPGYR